MQTRESLKRNDLEDKDYLMSTVSTPCLQNQQSSAIPESAQPSKKTISQDKLCSCEKDSQKQKSSKTLDLESISKERVCSQSWKDSCKAIQSHLLSHTEIACADSDLSSLQPWSVKTLEKSWFSTKQSIVQNRKSPKTFSPFFMSSVAECTDSGDTASKSKKIRIYPTKEQKILFKRWFGVQRFVFNRVIEYLNQTKSKEHWMKIAKDVLNDLPEFCSEAPYQIKKMAVKEAFQSFFTNVKKLRKLGQPFKLGFKSRKNPVQSCYIPHSAIKATGIYPRISGKGLRYAEEIPALILDSRLVFANNRWYIAIPTKETIQKAENQGRVVAVDPGIRCFATWFSEDGFGQIGYHDFGRIVRLCQHLDNLISRRTQFSGNQKRAMKTAENRLRRKIKDLVDELHHKTARFLVDEFDVIFYPTFETSHMTCRSGRKLRKKSVRSMLTYAFYRFAKHLEHKCFESGKQLIRVCEAYSSKYNSFNMEMMTKIGSKESFVHDGFRINRDVNGARNILCFSLVDTPSVRNSIANVSKC